MIDMHVHTWRCRHAQGRAAEYVEAAARAGVRCLCFCEHLPLASALARSVPHAEGYAMSAEELPSYIEEVAQAAALGEVLGVEVLTGIEADAVAEAISYVSETTSMYRFDVVLGAVHFIDGWAFDDPACQDGYAAWRPEELWERYFADVIVAARTGLFDVIAHLDLVKKFGFVPERPTKGMYRSVARELGQAGVAAEVNTAGLRKPCGELYPGPDLLRELRQAGVPVTVGSDAHRPEEVGSGLKEAREALVEAGYRSVLVFRDRRPEEVGLDEL